MNDHQTHCSCLRCRYDREKDEFYDLLMIYVEMQKRLKSQPNIKTNDQGEMNKPIEN